MNKFPGQLPVIKYSDAPTSNIKKAIVINPKARFNKKSATSIKKAQNSIDQENQSTIDLLTYTEVQEVADESDPINEQNESENIDFNARDNDSSATDKINHIQRNKQIIQSIAKQGGDHLLIEKHRYDLNKIDRDIKSIEESSIIQKDQDEEPGQPKEEVEESPSKDEMILKITNINRGLQKQVKFTIDQLEKMEIDQVKRRNDK